MPSALIIRHLAFEDLGAWEAPLRDRGFDLSLHEAGLAPLPTDPLGADLLIVLGGPIAIYDQEAYPWLAPELRFIEQRLRADRPTLGICLGAQAMAAALGARVYPTGQKEIGFAPISLTEGGQTSPLQPYQQAPIALHWHGDTFDLPEGATRLASTALTPNQAFALGPKILAVQFHPEAGGPGFERWLIGHAAELAAAGINPKDLRQLATTHWQSLHQTAIACLSLYLRQASLV
ncbi:MAG: glutamine amidotransferase [Caulobacterales bacterium]|jgi:GMP synthase (glutamine-hydrolysing)